MGRVSLRIITRQDSPQPFIREAYIRQPITRADVDFLPQGVFQAPLNSYIENSWKILSDVDLNMDNISCSLYRVEGINFLVVPTLLQVSTDENNQIFKVMWYANSSVINESFNYKVDCNITVEGILFEQVSQYVYINRERTFFEKINGIFDYLFGFITDILFGINQTVEKNQELLLNITSNQQNQTDILMRIEDKLDNLSSRPVFQMITQ